MSYRNDQAIAVERAEATDAAYARRARSLIERYQDDVGRDAGDTPDLLLAWLAEVRVQWSTSTWRQYRAALAAWYDSQGLPAMATAIRAIDTSACRSRTALPIRRCNTSARKAKQLREDDRAIL